MDGWQKYRDGRNRKKDSLLGRDGIKFFYGDVLFYTYMFMQFFLCSELVKAINKLRKSVWKYTVVHTNSSYSHKYQKSFVTDTSTVSLSIMLYSV